MPKYSTDSHLQTLKERFAEQIPEKVEQIKALRKSVAIIHDGSRLVANDG
jgi:hypothetical protein